MPLTVSQFISLPSINGVIESTNDRRIVIPITAIIDRCILTINTTVPSGSKWDFAGYFYQQFKVNNRLYRIDGTRKIFLNQSLILAIEPISNSQLVIDLPNYFTDWTIDLSIRPFIPENSNLSQLDERVVQLITNEIKEYIMGIFVENFATLTASTTATKTTVTVNIAATSIVEANPNRKSMTIKNTGGRAIGIDFTNALTPTNNYITIASNASFHFPVNYVGEIFALTISGTGTSTVVITEFT